MLGATSCPRIHPHYSGAERGFCCNAARTCSPAGPCQAGRATDLSSDTKPSLGTRGKIPAVAETQLSTSQHILSCMGWERQAQLIPPSQLGSISLLGAHKLH